MMLLIVSPRLAWRSMASESIQKILILDGDEKSRADIAGMVEGLGYAAVCVSSGQLALAVLKNNPDTALVVLDMALPEGKGHKALEKIRSQKRFRNLPVILISDVIKLSEIAELLELGPSYFVPKPVKLDDLAEYVSKSLARYGR